ncbi:unnamed protein product [Didymodactylos carnosus]|uniref:Carboxylic ester hydrolase n=1 Tax=Didymodactylos carnosus TaxID=1234261 RepID=A0A815BNK0_9BILA|nr:unnamed protein product [Didymodactylos carnosus]CAF4062199.1 unnamed protein product [Didymodactylos carnosus]
MRNQCCYHGPMRLLIVFSLITVVFTDPLLKNTSYGQVLGTIKQKQVRVWYYIPYALPPTGNYRWTTPQPPISWSSPYNATKSTPYPACTQPNSSQLVNSVIQEDCLYLTIYAPLNDSLRYPVMVWIHGGSNKAGSGFQYDGTTMVYEQNVIIVTINYRLGIFGNLALKQLQQEDMLNQTGTYGLLDQQFALKWINQNIENFGGNSSLITLFGESAGGSAICAHLTSPFSYGLFQRVIIESQTCQAYQSLEQAFTQSAVIIQNANCNKSNVLSCMRALTTQNILLYDPNSQGSSIWCTSVDGVSLLNFPIISISNGQYSKNISIFIGTNLNEYSLFLCLTVNQLGKTQSSFSITDLQTLTSVALYDFNIKTSTIINQLYPVNNYSDPYMCGVDIYTDAMFKCTAKYIADSMSSSSSVYMYSFEYHAGFSSSCTGIEHTYELPYIWPTLQIAWYPYIANSAELLLAKTMRSIWASFALYGTLLLPNGQSWPLYSKTTSTYGSFDTASSNVTIKNNFRTSTCSIFNPFYQNPPTNQQSFTFNSMALPSNQGSTPTIKATFFIDNLCTFLLLGIIKDFPYHIGYV